MSYFLDFQGFEEATPEEQRLIVKVDNFGLLFEDMLFGADNYIDSLMNFSEWDSHSGVMRPTRASRPRIMYEFRYDLYRFKVVQPEDLEDEDTLGQFTQEKKELWIRADMLESDATILHELIHLHEFFLLNEVPLFYRDMLFWALYREVKRKIPQLDDIILRQGHSIKQEEITADGGLHDILFLLKSFHLDMKMKYPLGTVFGYGKADELKDYSYIPYDDDGPSLGCSGRISIPPLEPEQDNG